MSAPEWIAFYIDPEQPDDGCGTIWRQTSTYWTPDRITATEVLSKLLPSRLGQPVWAFAHAKPRQDGAWYDLHYPAGVEPKIPVGRALGPHFWIPGNASTREPPDAAKETT